MIDLNIEPYEGFVSDEPPRTDVLYELANTLNLEKYPVLMPWKGTLTSVPPMGTDRYVLRQRVRFTKACHRWHAIESYGGSTEHYQCANVAGWLVEIDDEQYGYSRQYACQECAVEIRDEARDHPEQGQKINIHNMRTGHYELIST